MKFGSWSLFAPLNLLSNFQQNRPAGKIQNSVSFQDTSRSYDSFLFHNKDIGEFKSSTAAKAAKAMNISPATENIFDDVFLILLITSGRA
jgi:hypothetical protein